MNGLWLVILLMFEVSTGYLLRLFATFVIKKKIKKTHPSFVEERREHKREGYDCKSKQKHQQENQDVRRMLENLKIIINQ